MKQKENKLILYKDEEGKLSVNTLFADEDVWLTQAQLAEIYQTTQENISMHISNIYADDELDKEGTYKKFLLVRQEGKRQVNRHIDHYNLDMISLQSLVSSPSLQSPVSSPNSPVSSLQSKFSSLQSPVQIPRSSVTFRNPQSSPPANPPAGIHGAQSTAPRCGWSPSHKEQSHTGHTSS